MSYGRARWGHSRWSQGLEGAAAILVHQERTMKSQFQSTEALRVRLPPFLNKYTWQYITGSDVATFTIKAPDGTLLVSGINGVPAAVYDADVCMWSLDLPNSYYTAHQSLTTNEWKLYAVSNDTAAMPQWASYSWGDYMDDVTTGKTAAISVDSKLTSSRASYLDKLNITGNVAAQSDVAALGADIAAVQADVDTLKDVAVGKWVIDPLANQLVLYRWDGSSWVMFQRFNLFDKDGNPSSSEIYARIPV
jgi:hypothetical protein